jgi:uncharacterized protein (DUF1697 family)
MKCLQREFEALGFSRIETLIASGNVIFKPRSRNAHRLEAKTENQFDKSLGHEGATFIRSPSERARSRTEVLSA